MENSQCSPNFLKIKEENGLLRKARKQRIRHKNSELKRNLLELIPLITVNLKTCVRKAENSEKHST